MPVSRSNKARNQVKGDPVGADWFKKNIARQRKRAKIAKASKRKNRKK